MSKQTRRRFLQDSMMVTAAALAAGPITHAFAQEPQTSSPNEKLQVAVVGVNGRGRSHIGAFVARKDTEITYICDPDSDVGNRQAEEIGKRQDRKPVFEADLRKVLDDPDVDIVSIATPNHWHALGAIWAIQAGKDVYVEKPVSHNVSEGRRIVQAARKYDKICQTGTQCRSNPGMIAAMNYVLDGKLGKVSVARGLCYKRRGAIGDRGNYPIPASIDYDLWLGPAPEAPLTRPRLHYDWHWQWPYGNGDLGNQGIHQMDLARWGLGVEQVSNAVISYGGRFGYVDAGDVANTQVVMHDYGDRTLVFEVRGLETGDYKGAAVGVIFECENGYLVMTSYDSGAAFDPDGNVIESFRGGGDHFDNFIKAVRSRKIEDLNADILQGHLSSALCHLGNISYRLGETVTPEQVLERLGSIQTSDNVKDTLQRTLDHLKENKVDLGETPLCLGPMLALDPRSETFIDNAEADKMLTREYRESFVVPSAESV